MAISEKSLRGLAQRDPEGHALLMAQPTTSRQVERPILHAPDDTSLAPLFSLILGAALVGLCLIGYGLWAVVMVLL